MLKHTDFTVFKELLADLKDTAQGIRDLAARVPPEDSQIIGLGIFRLDGALKSFDLVAGYSPDDQVATQGERDART